MPRQPPDPHPFDVVAIESMTRALGLPPEEMEDWKKWRKPMPRSIHAALTTALFPRVPPTSWWVEGEPHPSDCTEPLPSASERAMFGAPMQVPSEQERAFEGRPPTDHPFVVALRAKGLTLTEWCGRHKLNRQRVKGWYTAGAGARQIPREWADKIEQEFGADPADKSRKRPLLPAVKAIWKNGIRE